ncbi:MAG TPA: MFS transporter [Galbitalea sp.]
MTTTTARVTTLGARPRARGTLSPMVTFVGIALAFVGLTFAAGAPSPLFVLLQNEWQFPSWVLTVAFAIYAVTLLLTLLVAGALSDHIGRRPVLIGALVVELASMLVFIFAPNIGWIIAARAIQGIATGAATSAFTASIVEYAPDRHKKLGALLASTAPVGGLALGALATGFAVQFSSIPSLIIFGFLAVVFALGTLVLIASPESVSRRAGAIRSLIPRLSIPRIARGAFVSSIPVMVATWMLGGLFLGLAPSIVQGIFHIESGLLNGVLVAVLPAAGAAATLAFGRVTATRTTSIGGVLVVVGVGILLAGITAHVFPLLFVGGIVGGAGFGAGFSGTLRTLGPLADPHQRAELFAGIYLVSYLAYGIPALVAGELIGIIGLTPTIVGYAAIAMIAAAIGLVARGAAVRGRSAVPSD